MVRSVYHGVNEKIQKKGVFRGEGGLRMVDRCG